MSGEVRLLDEHGETYRLLFALESLVASMSLEHFALIGGLAVMARLGRAHRGTQDIDTAVEEGTTTLALVVDVATSAVDRSPHEPVQVDSIEVGSTPAIDLQPDDLPEDEFSRAFILSHRWAFDTASQLTFGCARPGAPETVVGCRVAIPAALVAMKLQSAPRRPPARAEKAANDYLDLALLLSDIVLLPQIIDGLAVAPHGLGTWCAERIHHDFVLEASRASSRISASQAARRMTPDEVRQIGSRFVEMFATPG